VNNKNLFQNILRPTLSKRIAFFLISDILICILSLYFAFLLRFDFIFPDKSKETYVIALPFFVVLKIFTFLIFKIYKITWRYVSLSELFKIANSTLIVLFISIFTVFTFRNYSQFLDFLPPYLNNTFSSIPISVLLIDGLLFLFATSFLRISKRAYFEVIKNKKIKKGLRTVIIGAGNVGEMVLRDIKKQNYCDFYPIGFLDDDKTKIGTYIHNVKVLDNTENLEEIIKIYSIDAVIVAIPSLNHKKLRGIYTVAKQCGVKTIKIIPKIYSLEKPEINVKKLEDIKIEDLLARQTVKVDFEKIRFFISGKRVLITGAGGSIGREIALQTSQFEPSELILLDVDETDLFYLESKLSETFSFKDKLNFIVADIRDYLKLREVFERFNPQIVFHAAAYKHVPMMEYNPEEAIKVNIFGTYNLAKLSKHFNVEKFINISTDKAVKPKSIMGATKRLAEYICKAFNDSSKTEFISVRFGNVIGSRGSVLPLWLDQIKKGGPVTVTHPDMKRYFMTIPEAVSLVLMASAVGKGGEILVLDMGKPVRILELAQELIRIHGLEPYKDIDIKFTGIRPGENLFEEILTAEEGTDATVYEKIFITKGNKNFTLEEIETIMDNFKEIIQYKKGKEEIIRKFLYEILQGNKIPYYH